MSTKRLSEKQKVFAEEFVANGGNGTQAALAAYDTDNSKVASSIAVENLDKPSVQQQIEEIHGRVRLSLVQSLEANNAIAQAIESAMLDLSSIDIRARDSARKFLLECEKLKQSHGDDNKAESKHVHFHIPNRNK